MLNDPRYGPRRANPALFRPLSLAQGVYYLITGLWPVVHRRSFEAVTGPKSDFWLVRTAGVLIAAIGATLTLAGWKKRATPEMAVLGSASAAGLLGIDVVYTSADRIPPVYLLDAVAETGLLSGWLLMPFVGLSLPDELQD